MKEPTIQKDSVVSLGNTFWNFVLKRIVLSSFENANCVSNLTLARFQEFRRKKEYDDNGTMQSGLSMFNSLFRSTQSVLHVHVNEVLACCSIPLFWRFMDGLVFLSRKISSVCSATF
jgi:hypothetical protein